MQKIIFRNIFWIGDLLYKFEMLCLLISLLKADRDFLCPEISQNRDKVSIIASAANDTISRMENTEADFTMLWYLNFLQSPMKMHTL